MLIYEPCQRQIDLSIKRGDEILIQGENLLSKVLLAINTFFTGVKPEYVTYKGKTYDNRKVIIRPKEDKVATVVRNIPVYTCNVKTPYVKVKRSSEMIGTVDTISFIIQGQLIQFETKELKSVLQNIETKYEMATKWEDTIDCIKIGSYQLQELDWDSTTYTFKDGFALNLLIVRNQKTKKYKVYEYSFGLESNYQDTKELALKDIKEKVATNIELLFMNKLCKIDSLIDKKIKGETSDVKF